MDYATKEDLLQLKAELLEHIDNTRSEMLERIERSETTLLKEFRKWAVPQVAKAKVMEIGIHALSERVELLEERLTELEQK